MVSVKCGGCKKYHDSKEDVKACFAREYARKPASQKQLSFINVRRREDGEEPYGLELTASAANAQISILARQGRGPKQYGCQCPPEEPCTCGPKRGKSSDQAFDIARSKVPEGYYAVPSATGNNDLDFFSVDRPTEGRWAGLVFVKRIIGGRDETRMSMAQQHSALESIDKAGIETSAALYGQTIGRCYRCNRTLTDEVSRELGIGPTCRDANGRAV
jgi:hypothetical protein